MSAETHALLAMVFQITAPLSSNPCWRVVLYFSAVVQWCEAFGLLERAR